MSEHLEIETAWRRNFADGCIRLGPRRFGVDAS
jgi:hypothetical protein